MEIQIPTKKFGGFDVKIFTNPIKIHQNPHFSCVFARILTMCYVDITEALPFELIAKLLNSKGAKTYHRHQACWLNASDCADIKKKWLQHTTINNNI